MAISLSRQAIDVLQYHFMRRTWPLFVPFAGNPSFPTIDVVDEAYAELETAELLERVSGQVACLSDPQANQIWGYRSKFVIA